MLIDTGKDDALEEALQNANGAEHLPATPGYAPGRHHAEHGRATGGNKEHHLSTEATAQETARTQGEYVAPIEAGQDVRLVFLVPFIFLQGRRGAGQYETVPPGTL